MKTGSKKYVCIIVSSFIAAYSGCVSLHAETPKDLYVIHKYFESIEQCNMLLLRVPENSDKAVEIRFWLGMNYFRLGSLYDHLFRSAAYFELRYYEQLEDDIPLISEHPRLAWYKGLCYYVLEEYDRAIESFDTVILTDSLNENVNRAKLWKAAATQCKKGDNQTVEDWKTVIRNVSKNLEPEALFLCILENKYDKSNGYNLSVSSSLKSVKYSLMSLFASNDEFEKADDIQKKIKFNEPYETISHEKTRIDLYDPFLLKAFSIMCYNQSKRYFHAISIQSPDDSKFHQNYWLGRCYVELGDYNKAVEVLKKVKDYLLSNIYLGVAYWKRGDKKDAEKVWKKVSKNKDNSFVMRELAYTYGKLNINLDDAEKIAERALELRLEKTRNRLMLQPYYRCLGFISFEKNDIDKAIKIYNEGFSFTDRSTVESNDPEFVLHYTRALFVPNKLKYELITQSFLVLANTYKGAVQVHNAISGIFLIAVKDIGSEKITH